MIKLTWIDEFLEGFEDDDTVDRIVESVMKGFKGGRSPKY